MSCLQPNLPSYQILTVTPASSRVRILVFTAGAGLGLGLGTSAFYTCFNLHFTSPPSLFKLFPFLFGLALHVSFKTDPIGCITYLLISLVRRLAPIVGFRAST